VPLTIALAVSSLAIGLTVVAFGTSAPELVVSVDAALSGANDVAVGNVVGSNIANIALILGLAALLRPAKVEAKILRVDAPIMILVSFALLAVMADGRASRLEGCLLLVGLTAYTVFTFWEAGRESEQVREEFASAAPEPRASTSVGVLFAVAGLAFLVVGGHLLVTAAVELATLLGMSQAAIGLTIVAIGTSMPEFATSVMASLRGQGDIAIGNVVGSNARTRRHRHRQRRRQQHLQHPRHPGPDRRDSPSRTGRDHVARPRCDGGSRMRSGRSSPDASPAWARRGSVPVGRVSFLHELAARLLAPSRRPCRGGRDR
jgi:K+-dependent Na+/Ca+ exchanger-like protein